MVALCQPVGASFLPDFCYKVHGFDERLKVVSNSDLPTQVARVFTDSSRSKPFPGRQNKFRVVGPKPGGGVAPNGRTSRGRLGVAGMFFETKAACE